jgi:hypothetical protein
LLDRFKNLSSVSAFKALIFNTPVKLLLGSTIATSRLKVEFRVVGANEGERVARLGAVEGLEELGVTEGDPVGLVVFLVGVWLGRWVGEREGAAVSSDGPIFDEVGDREGEPDGASDGLRNAEGLNDGAVVFRTGDTVGLDVFGLDEGDLDGFLDGLNEGLDVEGV